MQRMKKMDIHPFLFIFSQFPILNACNKSQFEVYYCFQGVPWGYGIQRALVINLLKHSLGH